MSGPRKPKYLTDSYRRVVKDDIYHLVRPDKRQFLIPIIDEHARRVHRIIVHAFHFIALYITHALNIGDALPDLKVPWVKEVLICVMHKGIYPNARQRPKDDTLETRRILCEFWRNNYSHMVQPGDDWDLVACYTQVFQDEATGIITAYKNNVSKHYPAHLKNFMRAFTGQRGAKDFLSQAEFKAVKLATNKVCEEILEEGVVQEGLPDYLLRAPEGDSMSMRHLHSMLSMARALEEDDPNARLLKCLPMRTAHTPGHTNIDTKIFIALIGREEMKRISLQLFGKVMSDETIGKDHRFDVWNHFFRMDKRIFRPSTCSTPTSLRFAYRISTDGVGASVHQMQRDAKTGFDKFKRPSEDLSAMRKKEWTQKRTRREQYVHRLTAREKRSLLGKKLIAGDPNKATLVQCVEVVSDAERAEGKKGAKWRYTREQRINEAGIARRRRRQRQLERALVPEGVDPQKERLHLSQLTRKTTDPVNLAAYIYEKNRVNFELMAIYENPALRRLKLHAHRCKQRAESKMLNSFEHAFGKPKDTVLAIGDWSHSCRRNSPPTLGKGLRALMARRGMRVLLVNEYRTSKTCFFCKGENCTFHRRDGETRNVWGLLRCKQCGSIYDRDINSALNIGRIAHRTLLEKSRPAYLCRQSQTQ